MTEEQQRLAEGHLVRSVTDLPVSLKGIEKDFLTRIQVLHDTDENWDESGLSERGQKVVEDLRDKYNI